MTQKPRLTTEQAHQIRRLSAEGRTTRELSVMFNLGVESVRRILRGDTFAVQGIDAFGRAHSTAKMASPEEILAGMRELQEKVQSGQLASVVVDHSIDPLAEAKRQLREQGLVQQAGTQAAPERAMPPSLFDGGELPPEPEAEAALIRLHAEAAKNVTLRAEGLLDGLAQET